MENFLIYLLTFGYLGVFLVSLFGSATIFFPLPVSALIFGSAGVLNPFLVAIFAALGGSIGELTGYFAGVGAQKVTKKFSKKREKEIERVKRFFLKYGGFFATFIFAATPLPFDLIGLVAGLVNFDLKKFFFACFLGKLIASLTLALSGHFGIQWILRFWI
jgi:membrane protein DedA with SNARE-associated domain